VPIWGWILIAAAAVLLVAVVATATMKKRKTKQLQEQFGPEYDRTVKSTDSRKDAEAELAARKERHDQIELRPLSSAARERYVSQWHSVQAQFVDNPSAAVVSADSLIQSAMADRGYPVDDFDTRAADLSVEHPQVVENYRQGHRLAEKNADGKGSTEDLRQAMRHYRALFDELVEPSSDEPMTRDRAETSTAARDTAQTSGRRTGS